MNHEFLSNSVLCSDKLELIIFHLYRKNTRKNKSPDFNNALPMIVEFCLSCNRCRRFLKRLETSFKRLSRIGATFQVHSQRHNEPKVRKITVVYRSSNDELNDENSQLKNNENSQNNSASSSPNRKNHQSSQIATQNSIIFDEATAIPDRIVWGSSSRYISFKDIVHISHGYGTGTFTRKFRNILVQAQQQAALAKQPQRESSSAKGSGSGGGKNSLLGGLGGSGGLGSRSNNNTRGLRIRNPNNTANTNNSYNNNTRSPTLTKPTNNAGRDLIRTTSAPPDAGAREQKSGRRLYIYMHLDISHIFCFFFFFVF